MAVLLVCALPASAFAAGNPPGQPAPISAPPGSPTLVTSMTQPPAGFRLNGNQVQKIAAANRTVQAELKKHPKLVPYVYTRGPGVWQVSYFTPKPPLGPAVQHEMLQLYVDDGTGEVTQVWTGYQVAWTMARGYPGAFGRKVNALYVWLPMCAMFLLPFLPLGVRRVPLDEATGRRRRRWHLYFKRPTLWHLDLCVLLFFSVSLAFFNQANLGLSVPLVYPGMVYLMVRMVLLAFGRGRPSGPLHLSLPVPWLAVLLVFLVGFRIGLDVTDSNVIDVGYAGVIGADKILNGTPLYGNWPSDNEYGDTYGAFNYFAYVPFKALWGWSGVWDSLPAAHAASIAFDLLTLLGLMVLGWSIRGPGLAVVLGYLWAAFPFSLFVLCSNSNDSLVAFMVVLSLLVLRWATARGFIGALAALTKFAPFALAPLLLRGIGEPLSLRIPRDRRRIVRFCLFYGLGVLLPMLYVILDGNLHWFWTDSIKYQADRPAPFSVWGLYGDYTQMKLKLEQHVWQGLVVAFAVVAMFLPRGRRTVPQVAALGAAILIGLQMSITYWFYLYIVWFYPLVIVALAASHPAAAGERQSGSWRPVMPRARRRSAAVSISTP